MKCGKEEENDLAKNQRENKKKETDERKLGKTR